MKRQPKKTVSIGMQAVTFDIPAEMLSRVEALRKARADRPTRAQLLRELIAAGLQVESQLERWGASGA